MSWRPLRPLRLNKTAKDAENESDAMKFSNFSAIFVALPAQFKHHRLVPSSLRRGKPEGPGVVAINPFQK